MNVCMYECMYECMHIPCQVVSNDKLPTNILVILPPALRLPYDPPTFIIRRLLA